LSEKWINKLTCAQVKKRRKKVRM